MKEALNYEGDKFVLDMFLDFLKAIKNPYPITGDFASIQEPTTFATYGRCLTRDIFSSFRTYITPFDARWLLDTSTVKDCKIEGDVRQYDSRDPIYISPRLLRVAMCKYPDLEQGWHRSVVLATVNHLMNMVEEHHRNNIDKEGTEPLRRIMEYHSHTRACIDQRGMWKAANKDKRKSVKLSNKLKNIKFPNREAKLLRQYKIWIKSPKRIESLEQYLSSDLDDKQFTAFGNRVMAELLGASGARSVVLYKLTNGRYYSKEPGYMPYKVTADDSVPEEESEDMNIYRRVNPNTPPKELACIHQIQQCVAVCPVLCQDRAEPDGYNIWVGSL